MNYFKAPQHSPGLGGLILLSSYGSAALVDLGRFLGFLIHAQFGRTPCTGDQPVVTPLPTQVE
jgi:hypothetical protein